MTTSTPPAAPPAALSVAPAAAPSAAAPSAASSAASAVAPSAGPSAAPSTEQQALIALKRLRAKLEAAERAKTEPVAIVGVSCRLPGGADSLAALRGLLERGADTVTEVPDGRWARDVFETLDPENPDDGGRRWGSFLREVDRFDAGFFGISPREAERMDPQQRLLLELVQEALESAGLPPERLAGSATGVFVGMSNLDYADLRDLTTADVYSATGAAASVAAGRIAFSFDFRGPTATVDTACSSSLVAVHLACQSLRAGESEVAIAGGVSLMLSPQTMLLTSKLLALSPDGRCKTFDARANGFVRAEGGGAVVLKRLSKALADGDTIYAVIRGSAVNQDGRSTGLTAPNVLAQQAVIRQALRNAGLKPEQVGFVETHGTGTPLGDPIEYEALREVYGAPRPDGSPCVIGAVKTNFGHLEAAAGMAGLMKTILVVRDGL
ncbi:MAG TPA: polyketide synthase, partial [Polyangiaceae bacterium]|nr:polyketide synthase [Polyangiaceae bacterium]